MSVQHAPMHHITDVRVTGVRVTGVRVTGVRVRLDTLGVSRESQLDHDEGG